MKKLTAIIIVLLLIVLGAGIFLLIPESSKPSERGSMRLEDQISAVSVRATTAAEETLRDYIRLSGDIEAESSIQVYPDVAGTLSALRVKVGDFVQARETVAEVDPSRPGASYSISPVEAPIRGTVSEILVDPGDTVSTSVPILKIGDLNSLIIRTRVSERYVNLVRLGQPAYIETEANPGVRLRARVSEVYPVLDPASRSMKISLTFSGNSGNPAGIKAGMLADITLVTREILNAVTVPAPSVINRNGESFVFIIEDSMAQKRLVTTGLSIEGRTEITEGLEAGDILVSSGMNLLSDGSTVRIIGDMGEDNA